MKKNNKKRIKIGLIAGVALAPLAFVVSCGEETKTSLPGTTDGLPKSFSNYDFNKINWGTIAYWDAEIVKWIDGDTPTVNVTAIHNMSGTGYLGRQNIRLVGIDTPELHTKNPDTGDIDVLTKGKEFEWAEKGRLFGEKVAPAGTKIRIKTNGNKTFKRYSGGIYYGNGTKDDFSKNYSNEITKAGLTLPFITNPLEALMSDDVGYVYRAIADSYNNARKNKLGIFSPKESLREIYGIHGLSDLSSVGYYGSDAANKKNKSVYYYTKGLS